ncbi:MAG: hypothetical protein R3B40_27090 [Polyangiales bacterium]|nr:hypothetical protein [Myxococcales bacterium]MCB9660270.1 hypothetical protein [Sandaracinaceae bacterium]
MRQSNAFLFGATALLAACSQAADPPPPPTGAAPSALGAPGSLLAQAALVGITPAAVAPQFGGKVAIAGPSVVEVMPRTDGLVLAEVRGPDGSVVTTGSVSVQVSATDGQPRTVPLRWDNDLRVFEGSAGVALPPAPRDVQVTVQPVGAPPSVITLNQVPVAPVPANGGQVLLVGPMAPEVRVDADGSVHAFLPDEAARVPNGKLYVNVGVGQPNPQRVELQYVEDQGHYVAQLGPTARPAPGALTVEYETGGHVVDQGRTSHAIVTPASRLDGTVVVAGDYGFEVAPVDGELHATIADSSGVYVASPPPRVEVYVESQRTPVVMRWDATRRVYVAPLPPRVDVRTQPFRVEVRHNGRRHRGSVRVHHHGRGPRGRAVVHAPGPNVRVVASAPPPPSARVEVRVQAPPPPRVDVRISHPVPHGSVVIQGGGRGMSHHDNGLHRGHGMDHRDNGRHRGHGMGGRGR